MQVPLTSKAFKPLYALCFSFSIALRVVFQLFNRFTRFCAACAQVQHRAAVEHHAQRGAGQQLQARREDGRSLQVCCRCPPALPCRCRPCCSHSRCAHAHAARSRQPPPCNPRPSSDAGQRRWSASSAAFDRAARVNTRQARQLRQGVPVVCQWCASGVGLTGVGGGPWLGSSLPRGRTWNLARAQQLLSKCCCCCCCCRRRRCRRYCTIDPNLEHRDQSRCRPPSTAKMRSPRNPGPLLLQPTPLQQQLWREMKVRVPDKPFLRERG